MKKIYKVKLTNNNIAYSYIDEKPSLTAKMYYYNNKTSFENNPLFKEIITDAVIYPNMLNKPLNSLSYISYEKAKNDDLNDFLKIKTESYLLNDYVDKIYENTKVKKI